MARLLKRTEGLVAVTGIRGANGGASDGIFFVAETKGRDAMTETGIILECVGQVAMRDNHGQPLPAVKLYRAMTAEGKGQKADRQTEGEKKLTDEVAALFAARMKTYMQEAARSEEAESINHGGDVCSRSDAI